MFARLNPLRLRTWAISLGLIFGAYMFARTPTVDPRLIDSMSARFRFKPVALDNPLKLPMKGIRQVAPSLKRIDAWISSVGAAVTLADIDRDGLANDMILIDPRTDSVTIMPAPDSGGARYDPFELSSPLLDRLTMAPMGSLCGDFNEDGEPDILVYYWGRTPIVFLRKSKGMNPDSFDSVEIGPRGERWFTNAALLTDLDGDGHTDLVLGNYFQDGARILDAKATQKQYMQTSMSRAFNGGRNRFFLGAPTDRGAFLREVSSFDPDGYPLKPDMLCGWTLAMGACDLNRDGRPELFFGNDFGPDRLFVNESVPGEIRLRIVHGRKGVESANSKVLGNDSFKGMGVEFPDLNSDGSPDLLVSNIASPWALQESHQAFMSEPGTAVVDAEYSHYRDRSEALGISNDGWGWDVRAQDFDNDGVDEVVRATGFLRGLTNRWPELHELAMANDTRLEDPNNWPLFQDGTDLSGDDRNPFYVRSGNGRYVDIGSRIGLAAPQITRGISTGDTDGDGRIDLVFANQWGPSLYFKNESQSADFVGIHVVFRLDGGDLELRQGHPDPKIACRPAFGAQVHLKLHSGKVTTRTVDGGNGHSGKRAPVIHLGLGNSEQRQIDIQVVYRLGGQLQTKTATIPSGWTTLYLGQGASQ